MFFSFPEEEISAVLGVRTHFTYMSSFAVIGLKLTLRIREGSPWLSDLVAADPSYPGNGFRASWQGPGCSSPTRDPAPQVPKGEV